MGLLTMPLLNSVCEHVPRCRLLWTVSKLVPVQGLLRFQPKTCAPLNLYGPAINSEIIVVTDEACCRPEKA